MPNSIKDHAEVLFRQVHPTFYHNGTPASSVFMPNSGDEGQMSLDQSSKTTSEDSFKHYTMHLKKQSACVYSISVAEFSGEKIDCFEDPLEAEGGVPANYAHCLADYRPFKEKDCRNIAKRLKNKAIARGCAFAPPSSKSAAQDAPAEEA